jgi:hypothetical protein
MTFSRHPRVAEISRSRRQASAEDTTYNVIMRGKEAAGMKGGARKGVGFIDDSPVKLKIQMKLLL